MTIKEKTSHEPTMLGALPIQWCQTDALQPHPANGRIYGTADDGMVESVRERGISDSLLVTHDRRVISGHRRLIAAQVLELPQVPVRIYPGQDEDDILALLIESNNQRRKNYEQIGHEYNTLIDLEKKKRSVGRPAKIQGRIPEFDGAGRQSRDIIGARIGVDGSLAQKCGAVVEVIVFLERNGRGGPASEIRTLLLESSPLKAYQTCQSKGYLKEVEEAKKAEDVKDVIKIDEWNAMDDEAREGVLAQEPDPHNQFNTQDNDNVEWARWTWNPVTGCLHNCSYCYARDIANDIYEHKFVPAFLPLRLGAPKNTHVPAKAEQDLAFRNVFTCSMADLFGKWVPREWIMAVLRVVAENPQWNFLFLTKFPIRLAEFEFPSNAWLGTTVDAQARIPNAEKAFANLKGGVKWLSCEPMLERLTFSRLDLFDWVVVGGATRSTQTPDFRPPREWVDHLERQAREAGCRIYEKTNLMVRVREYPGQPDPLFVSAPKTYEMIPATTNVSAAFKMGYLQRDVLPQPTDNGRTG